MDDERRLELLRHGIDRLRDAAGRRRLTLQPNARRVAQHLAGQRRNRRRHGRAEEHRLAAGGQLPEDAADFREEAHVEHPVGLVEHEVLDVIELHVPGSQVIEEAARRRDDDVDPAAERVLLRAHADAAIDGRRRHGRMNGERVEVFENLGRQLARRRQDQRTRRTPRLVDQVMKDWQNEGGGLPAAGDGTRDDVVPAHRRGNRLGLNRRRPDEAELLDARDQGGMKLEMRKRHPSIICGYVRGVEKPSNHNRKAIHRLQTETIHRLLRFHGFFGFSVAASRKQPLHYRQMWPTA